MSESKHKEDGLKYPKLSVSMMLPGSLLLATMAIVLLVSIIKNAPAFLETEIRSLDIVLATIGGEAITGTALLLAWIPILICVISFVIVIGGVVILLKTNAMQALLAEIARLSALCPTLPTWWQRNICRGALATLVATLIAITGIFFTAVAVVAINILVVAIALIFPK